MVNKEEGNVEKELCLIYNEVQDEALWQVE